ncbi:phage tail protein [Sulfitobacter sp. OXR-159]|uniref:phage tail protein n=1 Tax=Sulfitobacter sp. OXR-159 TaxID=3100174 RepID=UPI002AC92ACF|nr:phage tail protein [Sulfitobacter sp. OXR-159]WPZ28975.1 phage tail protein [Sulfitobacter sp. OXR-159]
MGALVTLAGQGKIAGAIANGTDIDLTRMVVGDGLGNAVAPTETMTELVNEVYDVQLASVARDAQNANWLIAEATIPEAAGPFTVREVGLVDGDGDLFAVADYPATEKFTAAQGIATALTVRIIIVVSDTANVSILLNPSDNVIASRRVDTGTGLSGGGDFTQDRTHAIDWSTLDTADTIDGEDTIAVRKASDGSHVQMAREDFLAGLGAGTGTISGGANVGDGAGAVYKGASGSNLQFRKIKASSGVSVTTTGDNVVVGLTDMAAQLTA